MKTPLCILPYRGEPLASLLATLPATASEVLLVGPLPGESHAEMVAWSHHPDAIYTGWVDAGTYLGQEEDKSPTISKQRLDQVVKLRWSSVWTDEPHSTVTLRTALVNLDSLLARKFRSGGLNFASPVALGRHLMAAAWRMDNITVPPVDADLRQWLTDGSPQGRHECLTLPEVKEIPALYEYDMRLAYLWCCKGLPYGVACPPGGWIMLPDKWDKAEVSWQAPEGWNHIGILPKRQQGWLYPMKGEGLVDRREGDLATRNGWQVKMKPQQCIQWQQEGALDRWSSGLQWALREVREDPLERSILRKVALNTIGSLHRSTLKRYRSLPKGQEADLPQHNATLRLSEDGQTYFWQEEQPVHARHLMYVHPEWTTTIWARCRARMAQAALQFPREQVIALRQDALFTSAPHPEWKDDGAVGRLRMKRVIEGPLPAPHTLEEFDALRRGE